RGGERRPEEVPPAAPRAALNIARDLYVRHPHPGVHAAAWLLLRRWQDTEFPALHDRLASVRHVGPGGWGWEHGPNGHVFAILPAPLAFHMGASEDECQRFPDQVDSRDQRPHHRKIDRSLAVSMTEVTYGQIRAYLKD